jgi:hypothetical protein
VAGVAIVITGWAQLAPAIPDKVQRSRDTLEDTDGGTSGLGTTFGKCWTVRSANCQALV